MPEYRLMWYACVALEAVVEAPDEGYARAMLDDAKNNVLDALTLGECVEHVTCTLLSGPAA